ncbi:hypothetical protein M2390_002738 [Mycetocola sp. BIGb0189]|uniref:hypothetical protein n=1 Tax=Mycetocola sp. BIGb0189 TaxID=2940604 RepID=UPI002169D1D1|nr:hypothetical protein [Mycetocola sp. BIGb0189]MCS4277532.1 hypothetical protein [Mycetocola sp. BIGb0189]
MTNDYSRLPLGLPPTHNELVYAANIRFRAEQAQGIASPEWVIDLASELWPARRRRWYHTLFLGDKPLRRKPPRLRR